MQVVVNGIANGLLIGTLALSFAAVYLPTGVFHLALGAIYVLAPLITGSLLDNHAPWIVAVLVALLLCSFVSLACEFTNHRRLFRRNATPAAHLLSSLGIYMIVVHGTSMVWGDQTRVLHKSIDSAWYFFSIVITQSQAVSGLAGLACFSAYYMLLWKTGLGLRFRAMAANPTEAMLRGVNVPRLRFSAFAIAGFLAGLTGVMSALDKGFRPQVGGLSALTLAIVAFILGGRFSFWGPLVGGLSVGLVRSWTEYMTSSQWLDAVSYLLLVVFLLVKSDGLLGRPQRLESRV